VNHSSEGAASIHRGRIIKELALDANSRAARSVVFWPERKRPDIRVDPRPLLPSPPP
jgi:hypothetical protein